MASFDTVGTVYIDMDLQLISSFNQFAKSRE